MRRAWRHTTTGRVVRRPTTTVVRATAPVAQSTITTVVHSTATTVIQTKSLSNSGLVRWAANLLPHLLPLSAFLSLSNLSCPSASASLPPRPL